MTPARSGRIAPQRPAGRRGVPPLLVDAAGWSWRLLLLAALAYLTVRFLALIWLVTVPVLAALLFTALLHPLFALLRRVLPRTLAAIVTLVVSVAALGGVVVLIERRVSSQLSSLTAQTIETVGRLRDGLRGLGVGQVGLDQLQTTVRAWVQNHGSQLAGYLGTGAGNLVEFVTFSVLTLFVTFCLLYDGDRIWRWLLTPLAAEPAQRAERAGRLAWMTLARYIRGTAIIAVIHTVIIGGTLFLPHVPLAAPLAVLVVHRKLHPHRRRFRRRRSRDTGHAGHPGLGGRVDHAGRAGRRRPARGTRAAAGDHRATCAAAPAGHRARAGQGSILGGVVGAIASVPVAAIIHRSLPALLNPAPDGVAAGEPDSGPEVMAVRRGHRSSGLISPTS